MGRSTESLQAQATIRRARMRQRAVELAPIVDEIRAEGATGSWSIARALTERGIPVRNGVWGVGQVETLLRDIAALRA